MKRRGGGRVPVLDVGDGGQQHDVLGHLVAAGLELQHREPVLVEGGPDRPRDSVDVEVDRGQRVQLAVADVAGRDHEDAVAGGVPAAAVDALHGDAELGLHLLRVAADLGHHVAVVAGLDGDRVVTGDTGEGEVVVEPCEPQAGRVADVGDDAIGLAARDVDAELALPDLQGRLVARVVLDQGFVAELEPHHAVHHRAGGDGGGVEPLRLADRVDVHLADAQLGGQPQHGRALAVAVDDAALRVGAGHARDLELHLARAVEPAAGLLQRADDRERVVRLDRVVALDRRVARLPGRDEARVVVLDAAHRGHPARRPEGPGDLFEVAAVEVEAPAPRLHQLRPVGLARHGCHGLLHCHLVLRVRIPNVPGAGSSRNLTGGGPSSGDPAPMTDCVAAPPGVCDC